MSTALLALALQCLAPGGPDADRIAPAIVAAVEARVARGLPPITESPTLDVCLVATYVAHESGANVAPHPVSWDAGAGVSCGALQMACERVRGRSVRWQVGAWLRDVVDSSLAKVDSSPTRAAVRLAQAREMLRAAL